LFVCSRFSTLSHFVCLFVCLCAPVSVPLAISFVCLFVCLFAPVSVPFAISDFACRRVFDFCVLVPRILVPLILGFSYPLIRILVPHISDSASRCFFDFPVLFPGILVPLILGISHRVCAAHLRDERARVEVRVGEGMHLEYSPEYRESTHSLDRRHATTTHQMQRAAHTTRRAHFTWPAGVSPLSCGRGEPARPAR
jgi:hypothetical protein